MAAVHVGVGHDDDFPIAAFIQVEIFPEAAAKGTDDGADRLVGNYFHGVGFFDVEDFSEEGKNRLDVGIAPLLGGAAGGITFDEKDFGLFIRFAAAIRELAGQAVAFEAIFAAGELARFPRGFAR